MFSISFALTLIAGHLTYKYGKAMKFNYLQAYRKYIGKSVTPSASFIRLNNTKLDKSASFRT